MSKDSARTHYDKLAAVYDRRWEWYIHATLDFTLDGCVFNGDECVLDVACGTGELEAKLFARWPDLSITAVDVCPKMLDQARTKPFSAKVTWKEADATNLPCSDKTFDMIFCSNAFHEFRQPSAILAEFRRVLRPGGQLRIVDWCDDYITCKLCSAWLRLCNSAFHRTYSLKNCSQMIATAGFDVRRFERRRINWLWGLMLVDGHVE